MKTFLYCVSARNDFKVINRTTLLSDESSAMTDTGFNKTEKALIAELWVPANRAMIALLEEQIQYQIVLLFLEILHLFVNWYQNV